MHFRSILLAMSDTARDYQTNAPVSTDGMDQLFDNSEQVQDAVQFDVQDTVHEEITVIEASQLLKVDRRSIVRLIHWNKLDGRKDDSGKWLLSKRSVLARLQSQDTVQSLDCDVQDAVHIVEFDVQDAVQSNVPGNVQAAPANTLDLSSSQTTSVLHLANQQAEQLKNAYTYLDAATARIIYLQQQLENKEQQIKLLTDSQHKGGWWAKFSSWFFKGK